MSDASWAVAGSSAGLAGAAPAAPLVAPPPAGDASEGHRARSPEPAPARRWTVRPFGPGATTAVASAMLRHRHNWTRGVAAQHASLSRWRSPVRIRSGPPRTAFPYAPSARPDGAFLCPGRARSSRLAHSSGEPPTVVVVPVLLAVALAVTAVGLGVGSAWTGLGGDGPASTPAACRAGESPRRHVVDRALAIDRPGSLRWLRRRPSRRRRPWARLGAAGDVPIVPVTGFRATVTSTTRAEVGGSAGRHEQALRRDRARGGRGRPDPRRARPPAPAADRPPGQGRRRGRPCRRPREEQQASRVPARRRRHPGRARAGLGRQDAVRRRAGTRPGRLAAQRPAARCGRGTAFDPATTWTLFAGGDMLLDRGVYQTVKLRRKGVDFPFDGGTAEITSRYCCSTFGWELPRTQRTGNAGRRPEPDRGRRPGHRQLREPRARSAALPHVRARSSRRIRR